MFCTLNILLQISAINFLGINLKHYWGLSKKQYSGLTQSRCFSTMKTNINNQYASPPEVFNEPTLYLGLNQVILRDDPG